MMNLKQQPDMSVTHDIKILIDHHWSNLPLVNNIAYTEKEFDMIRSHFKFALVSFNCNSFFSDHWNIEVDKFKNELDS